MEKQKKLLAWLLAFALVLGTLPAFPLAAAASEMEQPQAEQNVEEPLEAAAPAEDQLIEEAEESLTPTEDETVAEAEESLTPTEDETVAEAEESLTPTEDETVAEAEESLISAEDEPDADAVVQPASVEEEASDEQAKLQVALDAAKAEGKGFDLLEQVVLKEDMEISLGDSAFVVQSGGELVVPSGVTLTLNSNTVLHEGKLTVEAGGKLIVQGGGLDVDGGVLQMDGEMTKNSASFIVNGGVMNIGGTLINSAPLHIGLDGKGTLNVNGTLTNYGYLNLCETGTVTVNGSLTNEVGENSYLDIHGELSIPGTLTNNALMTMDSAGVYITPGGTMNVGEDTEVVVLKKGALNVIGTLNCDGGIVIEENGAFWVNDGGVANINGGMQNQGFAHIGYQGQGTLNVKGTLTNYGYLNLCETGTVTVNGSLTNEAGEKSYLDIHGALSIPGTLTNHALMTMDSAGVYITPGGTMNVGEDTEVVVLENGALNVIGTLNCDGGIVIEENGAFWVNDGGVANINGGMQNQGFAHIGYHGQGTLNVNGSLTNYGYLNLPATGVLNVNGTLSNQAANEAFWPFVEAHGPINVSGTLENSNFIGLYSGATLQIQTGGQYAGSGDLAVYADTQEDMAVKVPGLDLTSFGKEEKTDDYGHHWILRKDATTTVNNELDAITSDDAAEIKSAVQAINTEELKSAMLADEGNTGGTVDKLKDLEAAVGTTTVIDVTDSNSVFPEDKITIVGAALNDTVDSNEAVKLVIDAASEDHELDEQYDSSAKVLFSMTLDNVANTSNLAVPVKITLPVPSNINPSALVILHYHDGTVETVQYTISQEDGQTYASFVLTGFSDFVMTQQRTVLPGDANGDGELNVDDAFYLVNYINVPASFPISWESADVNSDGTVDVNDAFYLVNYINVPNLFPLFPEN